MGPKLLLIIALVSGFVLAGCVAASGSVPARALVDPEDAVVHNLPAVDPDDYLHLFDYDPQASLDIREKDSRSESGLTIQNLSYASPKDNRVPTTLVIPDGKGPFAGLILMHGMPSTRQDFLWLGEMYAKHGMVVVLIDAPFNRPENADRLRPWLLRTGVSLTMRADDADDQVQLIVDLRRAVDLLVARSDVDPDRIAYLGISYGGAMGGLLAGVEDRLKASVLMVGDGGIVTHLTGFDDRDNYYGSPYYMLTEDRQQEWLEAMWPIEPIHFVQRSSPTALLFQNATRDQAVPPFEAARYQQAGSEPKRILWYDSPHFPLPTQSYRDNLRWLQRYVGVGVTRIMPSFRPSAVLIDWFLILWMLLTTGSFGLLAWDLWRGDPLPPGSKLYWLLSSIFYGPLSVAAYTVSQRRPLRSPSPPAEITAPRRALGSTVWAVTANIVGLYIALQVDYYNLPLEREYPILTLLIALLLPWPTGMLIHLLAMLISHGDGRFKLPFQRPAHAELISASIAVAGTWPLFVFLANRYFPFGLSLLNPALCGLFLPVIILGTVITYPVNLWMIQRGLVRWGTVVQEDHKAVERRPSLTVVLVIGMLSAILAAGVMLLTVKLLLDIPTKALLQLLMGKPPA